MSLQARVELLKGSLHLEVEIRVDPTEVVALVGPNGAGKTTLLRALAGLQPIREGRVVVGEEVLDDTSEPLHRAPEARSVSVVFQDHLLFPHLSVLDNVAYGLVARGARRRPARARALSWLEKFEVAGYAGARPRVLSGGQAQRVALARALATNPALLLLDEPLAAIDPGARAGLRRALRAQLVEAAGVRILVTHDPLDAMAMADRLVVLEEGRVTQEGTLAEVTARPRSPWAARLVGLNLYRGEVRGNVMSLGEGRVLHVATPLVGAAFGLVPPRGVGLHRDRPEGSPRNVWRGEIGGIDYQGDRVRVEVDGPVRVVAEVTMAAAVELRLADGGPVWVTFKATEVDVYSV